MPAILMALFSTLSGLVNKLQTMAFPCAAHKLPTLGSFHGTKLSSLKLQTLAALMAVFSKAEHLVNSLQLYGNFLTLLKCAIQNAKVGSLLTKSPTFLKSAIKSAKVWSLSDSNIVPPKLPMDGIIFFYYLRFFC